MEATHVR